MIHLTVLALVLIFFFAVIMVASLFEHNIPEYYIDKIINYLTVSMSVVFILILILFYLSGGLTQ